MSGLLGLQHGIPTGEAVAVTPPNILLIVSDDQTAATFNRDLMPNVFTRLVDRGVLFSRGYVNTPLCCPSRSQILTGLYGHHTGVDRNFANLTRPTIVQALHATGYRTMLAGKYLNGHPCEPLAEFDHWVCAASGQSKYSLVDPTLNIDGKWQSFDGQYTADILANQATNFIAATPTNVPFFALFSPPSPHLPANDPRCSNMPVATFRPPSYNEETRSSGKPQYVSRAPLTPGEVATNDANFTAMTRAAACLDTSIGTLLSSLGSRGPNTLVVYLSDNGFLYGQHRQSDKTNPYEESVQVPFVIKYPQIVPTTKPFTTSALVSNVDVAETIAEVAGISWAADGESLVPLLKLQRSSVREGLLIEHCQSFTYPCPGAPIRDPKIEHLATPSYWGIVTSRYKYLEYVTGERELYDLQVDPFELDNRATDASMASTRAELASKLVALSASPKLDTTIVAGGVGTQSSRLVEFTYFSQDPRTTYLCRLTKDARPGAWSVCNWQKTLLGPLADGNYTFEVSGRDEDGNLDPTPASRVFSISSTGPPVNLTASPPSDGPNRIVSFTYSSSAAGVSYECRLSRQGTFGMWKYCPSSGVSYNTLPDGSFVFEVRARDKVTGDATKPPAASLFQIDETGPTMVFDFAPTSFTRATSAAFAFHSSEKTIGRIICRLDHGPISDCANGSFSRSGLIEGPHHLVVSATDLSGITGASSFEWVIDRTAPEVSVSGPPPLAVTQEVTFKVESNEPLGGLFCRLDTAPEFTPCGPETIISSLSTGPHSFQAMAKDKANNFSDIESWTWVQGTSSR